MSHFKPKGIFKIIIPLIAIFLFSRCMHDEFDFNKLDDEMEFVVGVLSPVAYGSLSLDNIITEFDSSGYVSTYPDGLLYLSYMDSLLSFTAQDLLELPTQDFFQFYIKSDFNIPASPVADTLRVPKIKKFPFTFDKGEKIDSATLDSGRMVFDISSTFTQSGKVNISIPSLKKDGGSFLQSFDIPSGSPINYDLAGYTIYLQDSVGNDTMFFPVDFLVELYMDGVSGVSNTDSINIQARLENMDFDAIFGYIGTYELLGQSGEFDLGFFNSPFDGSIVFENPEINFHISNSYGVPAEVTINRLTGFDQNGDSIVMTYTPPTANTFRYAYPTLAEYGQSKDTTISIDGDNSTLPEFLAYMPSSIAYNIGAASNPDGEGASYNFVNDSSKVDVSLEFVLPLEFTANNFALVDTMELDLSNVNEQADLIERVRVMLEVSNGLPLDIDVQLLFLDSTKTVVDSLFNPDERPIIESGTLDIDNKVESPNVKVTLIDYTGDEINDLNSTRYGIIRAGLQTPSVDGSQVPVKFLSNYAVEFKLSLGVNVKANTNDL